MEPVGSIAQSTIVTAFGIFSLIGSLILGLLMTLMYIFLPKHKSDLTMKRRIITVFSGILAFLVVVTGAYSVYSMLFHSWPTLGSILIIVLIGIAISVWVVVKLYLVQIASIKTHELLERFEQKRQFERGHNN